MTTSADAVRVYERSYAAGLVDDVIRPGGFRLTDALVALGGLRSGDVVIDLGSGPGATVAHLRRLGFAAIGVDHSDLLLGAARDAGVGPLVRADGRRLPVADGAVDAVVAECTLSAMGDPETGLDCVLAEARRVLRPGGRLLVSDVYAREPAGARALAELPFASCIRGAVDRDVLVDAVRRNGFDVEMWEDRSHELRTFAAQLVWRGGSMRSFWCTAAASADPDAVEAATRAARPGYYLMVAIATGEVTR